MTEPHVTSALKAKQDEIKKRISALKKEIKACRDDLEAVTKTLRVIEKTYHTGGSRLFRRGDVLRLVFDALRENPEGLDINQMAAIVINEKGFNPDDSKLAATIRQRCMMAMHRFIDRGQIIKDRRGPERVWRLA